MVSDLNLIYKNERALHFLDEKREGFEWIDDQDNQHNCISFMRKSDKTDETIYVVCNFSNEMREPYILGVDSAGEYKEIFNSQSSYYEGSNIGNMGVLNTVNEPHYGREHSLRLILPPLGVIYLKRVVI
jgi:1,4-alpha-glucan branching enzyme